MRYAVLARCVDESLLKIECDFTTASILEFIFEESKHIKEFAFFMGKSLEPISPPNINLKLKKHNPGMRI